MRTDIENAVFRVTEIFEFAARLSETAAGDESMHIDVQLIGLKGRRLNVGGNRMPFFPDKIAQVDKKRLFGRSCSKAELVANRRDLALEAVASLFHQFGWDAPIEQLREVQQSIGRPY